MKQKYIYHITKRDDWKRAQATGKYRHESLLTEGFIHCSDLVQVTEVANRFYAEMSDLVLLEIDLRYYDHQVRYESPGEPGGAYPHLYGSIAVDSVIGVYPLDPQADGTFDLPRGLTLI